MTCRMNNAVRGGAMSVVLLGFLSTALLLSTFKSQADTLHGFFTNTISLDGDISDFFFTNGLPRPGVCVSNDAAPPIPGLPGSIGLGGDANEPNNQFIQQATIVKHPNGFNQRRIISAYNPNLNGG